MRSAHLGFQTRETALDTVFHPQLVANKPPLRLTHRTAMSHFFTQGLVQDSRAAKGKVRIIIFSELLLPENGLLLLWIRLVIPT